MPSSATLAQANQTLGGLAKHGRELVRHGFGLGDTQQLTDVRDGLQDERVGRGEEVTGKRVSREAVREALHRASGERDAARTILSGAAAQLLEEGDAAGASKIQETLRLTAREGRRGRTDNAADAGADAADAGAGDEARGGAAGLRRGIEDPRPRGEGRHAPPPRPGGEIRRPERGRQTRAGQAQGVGREGAIR